MRRIEAGRAAAEAEATGAHLLMNNVSDLSEKG